MRSIAEQANSSIQVAICMDCSCVTFAERCMQYLTSIERLEEARAEGLPTRRLSGGGTKEAWVGLNIFQ